MAKNFTVTAGSGTTIGADEVTYNAVSVKMQCIKLALGTDGAYDMLLDSGQQTMANSLPVTIASNQDVIASAANQSTMITSLQLLDDVVFAEDVASAGGDKGIQILCKRLDTPANSSGTDGDYEPLQISGGLLWTRVKGLLTPNGDSMVDDTNDAIKVNIVAGSSSGTQYTEDAAAAADPVGTMVILRRKDTLSASEVSADGDNIAGNATSKGELYVKHSDTIAVTQSGTWNITNVSGTVSLPTGASTAANQSTIITSLQLLDDTVKTDDAAFTPATDKVFMIGAFADEGSPDAVDEGDAGVVRMTLSRALHVNLRDASGAELSVGGGTQYTEDAVAAANPVGNAIILVRADSLAGVTTTDGDNVATRGTDKGEMYVKHVDAIPVTDNGGSLTVDGTVAATQSGTWNITNVSGTISLPTGAATAAAQATQLTALELIDDIVLTEDAAHSTGQKGVMGLTVRQDTAAALAGTDADYQPLITDASGRLHVNVGNTVTVGSHAVTNAGTFVVQENGAALTALQLIDDAIFADDAAFTVATSKVIAVGMMADETSTDSVNEGDIGIPRMTLDRKALYAAQSHTAGGATPYKLISAASTNATNVKNAAGQVYMITASNVNAAARYLKLYNKASSPTVGTDTPVQVFLIPGNTAGTGTNIPVPACGLEFTTGISFALTTGAADADTGAVASAELVVNLAYK